MKLHTSYYGNLKNIPNDYFTVSTSLGLPKPLQLAVDSWDVDLSPNESIFAEYKKDTNWGSYVRRFHNEILPTIDWLKKLEKWSERAIELNKPIENIVLLCYEAADTGDGQGQHCHRFILAEHFENEFNTQVLEYGYETYIRNNYKLECPINTDFLF